MSETNKVYTQELYNQNERTTEDGKGAGAYWQLNWEYNKEAPGETRVSWWLTKGGRSSSPTWLHTAMKLTFFTCTDNSTDSLYMTGKKIDDAKISNDIGEITGGTYYDSANKCIYYDSGRISTSDASARPNCRFNNSQKDVKMVEGSFIIKHDVNGRASFSVKCQSWVYYGQTRNGYPIYDRLGTRQITNALFVLPINMPYKACPTPTQLTITQGGRTLDSNGAILPWSTNLNNSKEDLNLTFTATHTSQGDPWESHIIGYQVYGKIGLSPSKDSYDFTFLINKAGTTIPLSDFYPLAANGSSVNSLLLANRGKTVYFAVATKSVGGVAFDSELLSNRSMPIKRLPVISFESTNVVFKSTTGDNAASFKTTYIGTNLYKSKGAIEYLKLGMEEWITNEINLPMTNSTEIKNLSFGSYLVRANDGYETGLPTEVSLIKNTAPTFSIGVNDINLESSYKDGNKPYYLHPTLNFTFEGGQLSTNSKFEYGIAYWTGSSSTRPNNESDITYCPIGGYLGASLPKNLVIQINPRQVIVNSNSNILKGENNIFYQITASRYDGIETWSFDSVNSQIYQITHYPAQPDFFNKVSNNNWSQISGFGTSFSNHYRLQFPYDAGYMGVLTTTFGDLVASSQLYRLSEEFMYAIFSFNNDIERGTSGELNYTCSDGAIEIFEGKLEQISRIQHPVFNNIEGSWWINDKDTPLNIFNVEKGSNSSITSAKPFLDDYGLYGLVVDDENKLNWQGSCNNTEISILSYSIAGDTAQWVFSNDSLYDIVAEEDWPSGQKQTIITILIKNVFEESYSFSLPITINFNQGIANTGNQMIKFAGYDDWDYLLEGMGISFSTGNISITSYNKEVYGQLFMTCDGVDTLIGSPIELTCPNTEKPKPGIAVNFTLPQELPQLPRISKDCDEATFGIKLSAAGIEKIWRSQSFKVKRTEPGVFILETGSFTNSVATINYSIKNKGGSIEPELSASALTDLDPKSYEITLDGDEKTGTFEPKFGSKDYTSVYVEFTTTFKTEGNSNNIYYKEYSSFTNQITIYNTTPTISYRKNNIGINRQDLSPYEDAILVAGQYNGRNKIYLVGTKEEHKRIINIETGELTNFIVSINGGSWDGTAPTGPAIAEETQF